MRYNVFTDFHHASLLQSLILLFERRLGGKLYRPIGLKWKENDYWAVYDHPFTIEQFLSTRLGIVTPPPQMYPDGTRPLNVIDRLVDGIYYCRDIDSDRYNKAITLPKFMSMKFDFVIASIPQHIARFRRLVNDHPNHPKLIYQIGNAWPNTPEMDMVDGVMASARLNLNRENVIEYHQEFDTGIFCKATNEPENNIYSFINCFDVDRLFEHDWQLFTRIEKMMPEWNFKAYGGQCRDGAAHGSKALAQKMHEAKFIWHTKNLGDGYGHIIHNAAAVGRPLIVKKQYYAGKMAEPLLIDGKTCVAIDGLNPQEIIMKINYFAQPQLYATMKENVYNNFKALVDFDQEAKSLEDFLERVKNG